MLKKYYLLLVIVFLGHGLVMAEKNQYDLLWRNNIIGVVTAERSDDGNLIYYSIKTDVTVNVGFKQHIEFFLENVFLNDTLQSAQMKQYRNSDLSQSASTVRQVKIYEFKKEDKIKEVSTPKISFTVAMLYFNEPVTLKSVYSESWGQYLTLKSLGNHNYQLVQPNGKTNTYSYKNGQCQSVTLSNTFYTITLKLKQ